MYIEKSLFKRRIQQRLFILILHIKHTDDKVKKETI